MLIEKTIFSQIVHWLTFSSSIYYYVQSSNRLNLICLIVIAIITIVIVVLQQHQNKRRILGTIICMHLDMICLILMNEQNLGRVAYSQLIVTQYLSKDLFQELKQPNSSQLYSGIIIMVSLFQIIYSNIFIHFDCEQPQLFTCLLLSLWQNLQIRKTSVEAGNTVLTIDNFGSKKHDILITNRVMSQFDLEKNFNGAGLQYSQHKNTESDNTITIDAMLHCLQCLNEGLIIFDRNEENEKFPYQIKYMNSAIQRIFGKESESEVLDIIEGFSSCQLQSTDINEDILIGPSIQRKTSQYYYKQHFELKDTMLTSIRNPFLETFNQSSTEKCSKIEIRDIFEKVQKLPVQACYVVQVQFNQKNIITNQGITTSQVLVTSGHDNNSLLELTITQTTDKNLAIICRDVTHRQKIRYLREYDKQKSKMLSFVSHEYRSPLNCIIQMLERVMSFPIISENFDILEQLQAALDNSNYILNLSNDLLDLAQIKNGKFRIQKVPFNLETLVHDCMKMFELKSKIQDVELVCDYHTQLPKILQSDRNRIKQILINLLSNAFKFTTKGKIEILLVKQSPERLRIGVKDEGIGISEDDQQKLFKAFSKVNSEESRKLNQQGVGLGLVISNQIAQTIGSSGLMIESKNDTENHFSYFYFEVALETPYKKKVSSFKIPEIIPQKQDIDEVASFNHLGPANYEAPTQQTCIHYLIVDDDCFNVFAFKKIFEEIRKNNCFPPLAEFDLDSVLSGKEALEKVKQKKCNRFCQGYKIIFMDIEMPIMNGHQTAQEILDTRPLQIIVGCSGYADSAERQHCFNVGMVELLVKPVHESQLIQIVRKYS